MILMPPHIDIFIMEESNLRNLIKILIIFYIVMCIIPLLYSDDDCSEDDHEVSFLYLDSCFEFQEMETGIAIILQESAVLCFRFEPEESEGVLVELVKPPESMTYNLSLFS